MSLKNFSPSELFKLLPSFLLIAGVTAISSAYIFAVYQLNSRLQWQDKSEFMLHVAITSGITISLLWTFAVFVTSSRGSGTHLIKHLFTATLTGYLFLLAVFYVVSLSANYFWGDNITFDLIATYITQLPILLTMLPFNQPLLYFTSVSGLSLCLLIIVAGFKLSRRVLNSLHEFVSSAGTRLTYLFLTALLIFSGYAYLGFSLFSSAPRYKFWKEPLLDFYLAANYVPAEINPWRIRVTQTDRQSRQRYGHLKMLATSPNIIIITVDSLRADHMGVYGYQRPTTPFLSRFHAQGKLKKVSLALATCPNSYCGILSILTAKPYRDISYDNFKVYDLLHDLGYRVYFIVSGDHMSWYNMGKAYGANIDWFFDYRNANLSSNDDGVIIEGLSRIPAYADKPAFFYFHLMSVHTLGIEKKEYKKYSPVSVGAGTLREVRINRYDNSVMQADAYIEAIFTKLEQLGYLRDSLVILTSDHGENLGEDGDLPDHGWNLRQHQISIPMLIYDSSKQEYKDLSFARQVDIAPTIADRVGVTSPEVWWGTSLARQNGDKCSYHESVKGDHSYAVVCRMGQKIYKYIVRKNKLSYQKTEELYELATDSAEQINLISSSNSDLVNYFRRKFYFHWEGKSNPVN